MNDIIFFRVEWSNPSLYAKNPTDIIDVNETMHNLKNDSLSEICTIYGTIKERIEIKKHLP